MSRYALGYVTISYLYSFKLPPELRDHRTLASVPGNDRITGSSATLRNALGQPKQVPLRPEHISGSNGRLCRSQETPKKMMSIFVVECRHICLEHLRKIPFRSQIHLTFSLDHLNEALSRLRAASLNISERNGWRNVFLARLVRKDAYDAHSGKE